MSYLINFEKEKDHLQFNYFSYDDYDYYYFHFLGKEQSEIVRMVFVLENSGKIERVSIEKKGKHANAILQVCEEEELLQYKTFFKVLFEMNEKEIDKCILRKQLRTMLKGVELEEVLHSYR